MNVAPRGPGNLKFILACGPRRAVRGARFDVSTGLQNCKGEKKRTGFAGAAIPGLTNANRGATNGVSARNPFEPAFVNSTFKRHGQYHLGRRDRGQVRRFVAPQRPRAGIP